MLKSQLKNLQWRSRESNPNILPIKVLALPLCYFFVCRRQFHNYLRSNKFTNRYHYICSHGGSGVALHCLSSRGIYSVGISALRCIIPSFAMVSYWPPLYARGAVFSLFQSLSAHLLNTTHIVPLCFRVRSKCQCTTRLTTPTNSGLSPLH